MSAKTKDYLAQALDQIREFRTLCDPAEEAVPVTPVEMVADLLASRRRVLIFGGRDFHDRPYMERVLRKALCPQDTVVHGGAPGADALAGDIAGRVLGHPVAVFPADWNAHGKSAGPKRNQEMLDSGIDFAIGFPGGRGTADMKQRLVKAGISLLEVSDV